MCWYGVLGVYILVPEQGGWIGGEPTNRTTGVVGRIRAAGGGRGGMGDGGGERWEEEVKGAGHVRLD